MVEHEGAIPCSDGEFVKYEDARKLLEKRANLIIAATSLLHAMTVEERLVVFESFYRESNPHIAQGIRAVGACNRCPCWADVQGPYCLTGDMDLPICDGDVAPANCPLRKGPVTLKLEES